MKFKKINLRIILGAFAIMVLGISLPYLVDTFNNSFNNCSVDQQTIQACRPLLFQ